MRLYFGNAVTTATTLMILALLGFMGYSIMNRASIQYWGRRSLILLVFGLVLCCFAAARDGLDKTIQCAIDGSCAPGLFQLFSIPTIVGCVGALLIIIAAIATPIAKTQKMREVWFYVMSGGAVLKIVTMEIARIITVRKRHGKQRKSFLRFLPSREAGVSTSPWLPTASGLILRCPRWTKHWLTGLISSLRSWIWKT